MTPLTPEKLAAMRAAATIAAVHETGAWLTFLDEFTPANVLALLDMLREAEAARDAALGDVERREKLLLICAAHCQGGHSTAGGAIAELFGIPFPVRMEGLEKAAVSRGLDPRELWPWLFEMRAERARVLAETAPADGGGDG